MGRLTQRIRHNEKVALLRRPFRLMQLVKAILAEEFQRSVYDLPQKDQYRLLVLDTWRQRYKVPIRYILKTLLPIYWKRIPPGRRKQRGIGVNLRTLTGRGSGELLKKCIEKDFPAKENWQAWRWKQKEIAVRRAVNPRIPRTMEDFNSPREYADYYARMITVRRDRIDKVLDDKERRLRPYRDNPWR